MRLSNPILHGLNADRVRRINEIYHNLENAAMIAARGYPQFEGALEGGGREGHRRVCRSVADYGAAQALSPYPCSAPRAGDI
jgi:hypothetical protein